MHVQICADTAVCDKVNQKHIKQLNDNMWSKAQLSGILVTGPGVKWQTELIGHGIIKCVQVSFHPKCRTPRYLLIKFKIMLQSTNHEVVIIEFLQKRPFYCTLL